MKAVYRTQYGSPDILSVKKIDKPQPAKDEILIRVHAATVNRTDCGILRGSPFVIQFFTGLFRPSRNVTGTDFAGTVVEIGNQVENYKVGDRVWGFDDNGLNSHAEFLTIAENKAMETIPQEISFAEAVACAEGAHYAYNFINKVNIKKGTKVLVNGATGAIGSAALQLLKHYGAVVLAVANTENIDLIKSLGADEVLDYKKEDFTEVLNEKFDFIFDAVGKSSFGKCKHLLKENGIYISSELGPGAENLYLPLWTKLKGGKRVVFPFPSNVKRSLKKMKELMTNGEFTPLIDKTYSIDEIKEVFHYVETGQKTGNVILEIKNC